MNGLDSISFPFVRGLANPFRIGNGILNKRDGGEFIQACAVACGMFDTLPGDYNGGVKFWMRYLNWLRTVCSPPVSGSLLGLRLLRE